MQLQSDSQGGGCIIFQELLYTPTLHVIIVKPYRRGHGAYSKHDNSQCSFTPDYGYRWSTNRKALHAYTLPEGINRLPCMNGLYGRSNFSKFWTKIWPSNQPKATNDTLVLNALKGQTERFVANVVRFWEIAPCPVNCTHLTTFRLRKITTANDIKKNGFVRPCTVHHTIRW